MKWKQLHLLTVVVVALLAGVMVWLNFVDAINTPHLPPDLGYLYRPVRGWPLLFEWFRIRIDSEMEHVFDWRIVIADVAICVGLLVIAVIFIEWNLRPSKRKS